MKLTHLIFADDLLLFCKADLLSIRALMSQFDKFAQSSGLMENSEKCEVYFAGINSDMKELLAKELGMKIGKIPFRYLGIPLSTKKLRYVDCQALVSQIIKPITHWATKFLSYRARLTLITSVLSSINSYWAKVFLLPKSIVKEVEGACRGFLWSGREKPSKKAHVSWDKVCQLAVVD